MMKKVLALLLCGMFAMVAFAGCSSKYRSISDIQESGKLVMMTNAEFEPYEYMEAGVIMGVDPDLAQMVADKLGVELEIVNMDFDLLVEALKSGKGDMVAAGMANTPERAQSVDFSQTYVNNGLLVVVPTGSDVTEPTAEALAGLTIAVQEGTTAHDFALDNIEGASVLSFKDVVQAGTAVSSGKADVAIMDIKPGEGVVTNSNGALQLLEGEVSEEEMAMAVAKGNSELLAVINEVLSEALANGTIDELVDYHMEYTTRGAA